MQNTLKALSILFSFFFIFSPLSHGEKSGTEILKYLQDFDSVYMSGFSMSGTFPTISTEKKWKLTTSNGMIAYEEEVVEIKKLRKKGGFIPLRRTWFISPESAAQYDWIARVYQTGQLPPWPENSPGPATSGSLTLDVFESTVYVFPVQKALWSLGRGYSEYLTQITSVTREDSGLLSVTADGIDAGKLPGAKWNLLIDPDAAYMVREAKLYQVGEDEPFVSIVNSGTKWAGSRCVPEQTELNSLFEGKRSYRHRYETASSSPDERFLEHAKLTMNKPFLVHTDTRDFRLSPELYLSYKAGELYPKGHPGKEEEILFEAFEQLQADVPQPKVDSPKGQPDIPQPIVDAPKTKIDASDYDSISSLQSETTPSGPDMKRIAAWVVLVLAVIAGIVYYFCTRRR